MKNIDTIKDERFRAILSEVETEIKKLFGTKLKQLILYGSYARNQQDPESDIDIMILVDENENTLRKYNYKIADIMTHLSLKHDTFISLTDETYSRYNDYLDILPFFHNIAAEGIEIYGQKTA